MRPEQIAFAKGYRVDIFGVVTRNGRVRKLRLNDSGYYRFTVCMNGGTYPVSVSRLQAFQKFGEALYIEGIEVRHLDNNCINNSAGNIALGTKSQNAMDKTPETRKRVAAIARMYILKHDHAAVRAFYHENGKSYRRTKQHFGITSSGTLHFILNKSLDAGIQANRISPSDIAATGITTRCG